MSAAAEWVVECRSFAGEALRPEHACGVLGELRWGVEEGEPRIDWPEGGSRALVHQGDTLWVYDAETGLPRDMLRLAGGVGSAAITSSGERVYFTASRYLLSWAPESGELVDLGSLDVWAVRLALSDDGSRIALARWEGGFEVRRADTGDLLGTFPAAHREDEKLLDIALDQEGRRLAAAYKGGLPDIQLGPNAQIALIYDEGDVWDVETGRQISTGREFMGGEPMARRFLDPKRMTTGASRWSLRARDWYAREGFQGFNRSITRLSLSPDGSQLLAGQWLVDTSLEAEPRRVFRSREDPEAVFASDGGLILIPREQGELIRRPLAPGQPSGPVGRVPRSAQALAVSRSGARVGFVVKGQSVFRSSRVFVVVETSDGRTLRRWEVDLEGGDVEDPVTAAAFGPDEDVLLVGTRSGRVEAWDIARAERFLEGEMSPGPVHELVMAPGGTRLLARAGDPHRLVVFDARRGGVVRERGQGRRVPCCVASSPDGGVLAVGWSDRSIELLDQKDLRPRTVFAGHLGPVRSLVFSPDGARLYSGGADRTVYVWDVHGAWSKE